MGRHVVCLCAAVLVASLAVLMSSVGIATGENVNKLLNKDVESMVSRTDILLVMDPGTEKGFENVELDPRTLEGLLPWVRD